MELAVSIRALVQWLLPPPTSPVEVSVSGFASRRGVICNVLESVMRMFEGEVVYVWSSLFPQFEAPAGYEVPVSKSQLELGR